MLAPSLSVTHLAIATVCTVIMIGLGFLARPGRATALWSVMFVVWMAAAFLGIAAETNDSVPLWLISVGAIMSVPAFVWSGLRAFRGARSHAWVPAVIGAGAIVTLLLTVGQPGFHVLGRAIFLISGLSNVLVLHELFRRPEKARGFALPLVLASGAWIVMGAVGVAAGVLNITDNYQMLTQSNAIAAMIYQIAALATLMFLVRDSPPPSSPSTTTVFFAQAADRLARAEAAGEQTWTLLDIRLDDAEDLRAATGESRFLRRSELFRAAVRSSFPAEADVAAVSQSRALVLVARTSSTVSACIRRLMAELEELDQDAPTAPQVSASVGWADVSTVGYDFDALLAAADSRAVEAMAEGGDRWKRT